MDIIFLKKRNKENKSEIIMDIGSESVKTILIETSENKSRVTSTCVKYFDEYEPQNSFFNEKAIKGSLSEIGWNRLREKRGDIFNFLLTLSSMFLRSQIVKVNITLNQRVDKKREAIIFDSVKEIARKQIFKSFKDSYAIPSSELFFINFRILTISIDGYQVAKLAGYFCKEVEIKVLVIFLLKRYSETIKKNFLRFGINKVKIIHQLEGILALDKTYFSERILFLDVGGKITDIFLLENNSVEFTAQFNFGSENFSYEISQRIGIPERDARVLKERYTKNELSFEVSRRVRDFLMETAKVWFVGLKDSLNKNTSFILPAEICISGGGAFLPPIKEILENGDWRPLDFISKPKVKFIYPAVFGGIEMPAVISKNSQFTNSLLIHHAQESY